MPVATCHWEDSEKKLHSCFRFYRYSAAHASHYDWEILELLKSVAGEVHGQYVCVCVCATRAVVLGVTCQADDDVSHWVSVCVSLCLCVPCYSVSVLTCVPRLSLPCVCVCVCVCVCCTGIFSAEASVSGSKIPAVAANIIIMQNYNVRCAPLALHRDLLAISR